MEFTNFDVEVLFDDLNNRVTKTIEVLESDFTNVRTGRANPHVLDKITVDYYGTMSPINQVGNISVPESKMITIAPWDASMLKTIEKAILQANIGLTPSNDGKIIRLIFPDITEQRRKELVKQCKTMAEDSKVAARNVRRDAMDKLKKMKTAKEITEDENVTYEKEVDKIIAKAIETIDNVFKNKEKDVLSV